MALDAYREKRDFSLTAEPRGEETHAEGDFFCVQKHAARRLHYDFRLEMDGVLKSWAVPNGPSLVPGEKRLAVHVEDHPREYGDFEGVIPAGEYGAGAVLLWDRGHWRPVGDPRKGYAKGHLEFELRGEKLKGRWRLLRMAARRGEKHENWLLIKARDEAARDPEDPDILEEAPLSVKTGRGVEDIAEKGPSAGGVEATKRIDWRAELSALPDAKEAPLPEFVPPALATSVKSPPAGNRWIHEVKFDGYRIEARIASGRVQFLTRNGLDWTEKFGEDLASAFRRLPLERALIDGEVVVLSKAGAPDFSALQAALSEGRSDRFIFYAFDLLYLDGYDLRGLAQRARKALLREALAGAPAHISYSEHFDEDGARVLRHACRLGLEGVVSKRADAPYVSGRGTNWLKAKCLARQEFVIGGYAPSTAARNAIGALALGVYEGRNLRYVGRVGTGFSASVAEKLFARLEPMRVDKSPFAERLPAQDARRLRYVRPELVAEIEFRAWTAEGRLRHASFRGLREDKAAEEIVRETHPQEDTTPGEQRATLQLTHPDRLFWPEEGVTKEGLAQYYSDVWRYAAPFIVGRPLALLRCPDGILGERFFQKHAWKSLPESIERINDPKEGDAEPLISVKDFDGMIGLVQSAALEIHPWGSTVADWERPDMIVMDLDPGEGTSWESVIAAAQETKTRLNEAGLAAFVKTSGGKGLHVVSPLQPKAEWPGVKAFTKAIADGMAGDSPGRYVSTVAKSKRRGKILVDYLRNQRGQTAVAAYSTRARAGAPVSAPLAWEELNPGIGPAYFDIFNMPTRVNALERDPWDGFREAAAPLENARKRRK